MIGVVKVASGKPQTGRIKLNISSGTWEAKFSFGKGKQSTGSGFTGSVTEGCFRLNHSCFGDQDNTEFGLIKLMFWKPNLYEWLATNFEFSHDFIFNVVFSFQYVKKWKG